MKFFIVAVSIMALGVSAVSAQSGHSGVSSDAQFSAKAAAARALRENPQDGCSFTFSSGSGMASIKFCVTGNGNIAQLEIPAGVALVSQASQLEGYGICDRNTNVAYSDWNGVETGTWDTARVVSHSATSVKIARSTGDGIWTLTQTIAQLKGAPPGAKIAMALTNNSAQPRDVNLVRYADMDVATVIPNNFDTTLNTAMAWNSMFVSEGPFGVVLQNLVPVPRVGEAVTQNTADPPDPCSPKDNAVTTLQQGADGSLEMVYSTTVRPHKTVTLTSAYKGR